MAGRRTEDSVNDDRSRCPDDLTELLGVVAKSTNPRLTDLLPARHRNRTWCGHCHDRKATHTGIDAVARVALTSGCEPCMTMWVLDPEFLRLAARVAPPRPERPKPFVCGDCGKACSTARHLATHREWNHRNGAT
jgi:hypothetical protein